MLPAGSVSDPDPDPPGSTAFGRIRIREKKSKWIQIRSGSEARIKVDPRSGQLQWIRVDPDPKRCCRQHLLFGMEESNAQTTPYFNKRTRHVRMDKVFGRSSYAPQVKPGLFSLEPPREGGNALRHPSRQIGPDSRPRHWPRPEDCNLEN